MDAKMHKAGAAPGRVTIRDVATAAGVSPTTVSDSLTGKGRLSEETRKRVAEIAKNLGYQASSAAKNLAAGRTGVIMMSIALPGADTISALNVEFFVRVMSSAAETASRGGYALAMAPIITSSDQYTFPYDGAIVVDPVESNFLVKDALRQSRPIVTVGRLLHSDLASVDNDYTTAVPEVLDHFVAGGSKRPALMQLEGSASYLFDVRQAYIEWCKQAGIDPVVCEVPPPPTDSAAERALHHLLETERSVDAILAGLDRLALGVGTYAESMGLHVPKDMQIASIGDSASLSSALMPITALDLNPTEIGRLAAEAVIQLVEGGEIDERTLVPTQLRARNTTWSFPES